MYIVTSLEGTNEQHLMQVMGVLKNTPRCTGLCTFETDGAGERFAMIRGTLTCTPQSISHHLRYRRTVVGGARFKARRAGSIRSGTVSRGTRARAIAPTCGRSAPRIRYTAAHLKRYGFHQDIRQLLGTTASLERLHPSVIASSPS
jgi:hypothetical protein